MEENKLYSKLLIAMLNGKSFRITNKCRESIKEQSGYLYDSWFRIIALRPNNTLDLCGNFHMILENYSFDDIVIN